MMTQTPIHRFFKTAVADWGGPPYSPAERPRWGESFLLALLIHGLFLIGISRGFVRPPDYGVQGSAASMEVYMVAAAPESVKSPPPKAAAEDPAEVLPEAAGEMEVARLTQRPGVPEEAGSDQAVVPRDLPAKKSEAAGDGSSPEPGPDTTTFFSKGASETAGRAGKYQNPPPPYPRLAQQKGWQGVVLLKALIEHEGYPSRVLIEKSSGHRILDAAAMDAVRKWQFTAASAWGQETSAWLQVPIRYVLEPAEAAAS